MASDVTGFNFKDSASVAFTLTSDDPVSGILGVEAATVINGEFTAVWAGPVPTAAGPGLVLRVPQVQGADVTFSLSSMFSRLEVLPANTTTFRCEKSAGGGAFTASTIASLSHTITDYEKLNAALSGTVTSGDLLRLYFATVAGSGGAYEVQLQGVTT